MAGKHAVERLHKGGTLNSSDQHNFFTISYFSFWNAGSYQLYSAGIIINIFMIHI